MASIGSALERIKTQLQHYVPAPHIQQICQTLGHTWRQRLLDPATSVQLLLLQLLAGVALGSLRHLAGLSVSAQAICQARQRLPLGLLQELLKRLACPPPDPTGTGSDSAWKGHRLFLADGMSFLTPDTPPLARKYGKSQNQRGTSRSYPVPKLLAVLDRASGLIAQVVALPWDRNERTCLSRLFAALHPTDLLLGDRGLVSFAHLALLQAAALQGCFRLPRWLVVRGRGRAHHRARRRLGKQDGLVTWTKAQRPSWMSQRRWQALPEALTLRQIAYRICRPGFRTHWAWLITTLTDPQRYPAAELVELYGQRWQVEVYFRDLKRSLGLHQISARTVAGVRKEILGFVLLYNLVRQVMQQAATRQGVEADRLSFTDAMQWLRWSAVGAGLPTLRVNARRPRPTQPRRLKRVAQRYPRLNRSRVSLCKPPFQAKL